MRNECTITSAAGSPLSLKSAFTSVDDIEAGGAKGNPGNTARQQRDAQARQDKDRETRLLGASYQFRHGLHSFGNAWALIAQEDNVIEFVHLAAGYGSQIREAGYSRATLPRAAAQVPARALL